MKNRVLSINGIPVAAEVSDTEASRAYGLMNRDSLPEGSGMLFVFPEEGDLSFWMKNTRIPLSIAFISSTGEILNIEKMYPYDHNSCYSSSPAQYALEVPQGWFDRKGIKSGDLVVGIPASSSCSPYKVDESTLRSLIRECLL